MKKKFELICWLLFTVFSSVCLFINFMSEPPVDDVKKFTIYMLLAAGVSVLYPAIMFALGLRNRHLYEQLNADAEQREALETEELKHQRAAERRAAFSVQESTVLVSSLSNDDHLRENEKDFLLDYIKKK